MAALEVYESFNKFENVKLRYTSSEMTTSFWYSTNFLHELPYMKVTSESVIKQQILVYKTTVYMRINGSITRQKQTLEKRWYYSTAHWHLGNVMLGNISFS